MLLWRYPVACSQLTKLLFKKKASCPLSLHGKGSGHHCSQPPGGDAGVLPVLSGWTRTDVLSRAQAQVHLLPRPPPACSTPQLAPLQTASERHHTHASLYLNAKPDGAQHGERDCAFTHFVAVASFCSQTGRVGHGPRSRSVTVLV